MKVQLFILMLLLLSNRAYAAGLEKTSTVVYSDLHFSVKIPSASEKHTFMLAGNEDLHDVYVGGEYAYEIRVIKASDDLPASTAVEKIIQEQIKSGSKLGSTVRWELDSRGKMLFKGFTRPIDVSEPFLEKIFVGRRCVVSAAMAALGDEFSPIVAVGVMGRVEQSNDVESLAKYLAFTVSVLPTKPAMAASPGYVTLPTSPSLLSPNSKPRFSDKCKPAIPASHAVQKPQQLRKGEIELEGVVESISGDGKSLVMQVSQVTMPGSKPTPLKSSRPKTVLFGKLPSGVVIGSRIAIIGRNKGIGSPIRAGVLIIH